MPEPTDTARPSAPCTAPVTPTTPGTNLPLAQMGAPPSVTAHELAAVPLMEGRITSATAPTGTLAVISNTTESQLLPASWTTRCFTVCSGKAHAIEGRRHEINGVKHEYQ